MLRGVAWASLAIAAVALPVPAGANSYAFPIDIRAKPLAAALQELARQTGIELMYDRALVRGLRAPATRGRMTVEAALARLLDGSGLVARRAHSGAWLIARQPTEAAAAPAEEIVGPELLVTGRPTQNVDIRRRENDIQPYRVDTGEQVRNAHRDDIDQYFRSRVTGNTQVTPPSALTFGETNSEIDLRGLGSQYTLVLVDGRRVPSTVGNAQFFSQPDLNAIPLHAVDRIETLTGTSGGIHGFGALGGATNIVLRRDYHGLELHATSGISARGDARRLNLEAGVGLTPDGGRTELTMYFGRGWNEPLLEGQRGYTARARRNANRFDPSWAYGYTPTTNSVTVFAFDGRNLAFKPEYGGTALGSDHSFLPTGLNGTAAGLVEALTRNAGLVDDRPPINEDRNQLGATATTTSAILSLRHRFDSGIEVYLDGLVLRNRGRSSLDEADGDLVLFPSDAINPFDNIVWVTFPSRSRSGSYRTSNGSDRYTAGAILPLPFDWKGNAEASFGSSFYRFRSEVERIYLGPFFVDGSEDPAFNPFGDWDAFQRSLSAYEDPVGALRQARSQYRAQSLRLTGPMFRTAAGAATATVSFENLSEKVRGYNFTLDSPLEPEPVVDLYDAHSSATRSFSLELRVPVTSETASIPLLRGLELQLAARNDRQVLKFTTTGYQAPGERHVAEYVGTSVTLGAKFFPLPWLMLRGSYATGYQPPEIANLVDYSYVQISSFYRDPKRGNDYIDSEYLLRLSGSPDLKAVRATTLFLGAVLDPFRNQGPRFSLDYSRIRRTGDYSRLDETIVLANEDMWPERVVREPMTDADRAQGFTGGRIVELDTRGMNGGTLTVDTLDARIDWTVPFVGGTLHSYGAATWQMRNRRKPLFAAVRERVGYADGPLRWRANGGAEWTFGRTMVGANAQYFSRHLTMSWETPDGAPVETQGSKWVRAQIFVDLYARRRFEIDWAGKRREVSVDLGIVNLFDRAPAYHANDYSIGPQYSYYGDPRRRRFELSLSAGF